MTRDACTKSITSHPRCDYCTSNGTSKYKWNARNQLTNITGTIKATYGYDPF